MNKYFKIKILFINCFFVGVFMRGDVIFRKWYFYLKVIWWVVFVKLFLCVKIFVKVFCYSVVINLYMKIWDIKFRSRYYSWYFNFIFVKL